MKGRIWIRVNVISWIWIRIRIKVKGMIRIRIRIKVIRWIRINLQMTSQNVWKMSLFEHFFKVLSLNLESRIPDPEPHQCERYRRIRTRIRVTSINVIQIRNTAFNRAVCQGIWAGGVEDATCTAPNHKFRLMAFGRKNSQVALLYST